MWVCTESMPFEWRKVHLKMYCTKKDCESINTHRLSLQASLRDIQTLHYMFVVTFVLRK